MMKITNTLPLPLLTRMIRYTRSHAFVCNFAMSLSIIYLMSRKHLNVWLRMKAKFFHPLFVCMCHQNGWYSTSSVHLRNVVLYSRGPPFIAIQCWCREKPNAFPKSWSFKRRMEKKMSKLWFLLKTTNGKRIDEINNRPPIKYLISSRWREQKKKKGTRYECRWMLNERFD